MDKKVILITGASSGIGYSTALELARRGHTVYAAARRTALMEPLKAEGVTPMGMDVCDEQSMADGVARVLREQGRIDVLVNNAGFGYFGAVETVAMEEARRQLEVNLFGLARLCQLVLPSMRAQGAGRIVNISSIAGRMVFLMGGWYHVSKYSVEALSDAMRLELKPFGIEVSMVEPGPIKTDWGLIAADHLRECSQGTAYEAAASSWSQSMHNAYSANWFSGPQAVTKAIVRAVESRRPRARYQAGRFARTALVAKALLPTRAYDAMARRVGRIKL
ncbi:MAG: SDR family NAD(P)-dependent oxidoreductase [Bacteroidales bacterium]|nr:SDR family NAD(P)-dependent oxidoreductase [Bacteroidales bacterium]